MKQDTGQRLEQILESAIVAFWNDLIPSGQTGLIHLEYGFAPPGTLDYLKVWSSSIRGRWLLACEYWMSASMFHGVGVRLEEGYQSDGLVRILEFVMQHQTWFELPLNHGRQGLIQISTPTEEEIMAATESVNEVFDRRGLTIDEATLA